MRHFPTFTNDLGLADKMAIKWQSCRKKPIIIRSAQITDKFRVDTLEGDYKQGKPGDYLMEGIDGELYICDRDIFEKTYDIVED